MVTIEKPTSTLQCLFDVTPTFPASNQISAEYHYPNLEDNSPIGEAC